MTRISGIPGMENANNGFMGSSSHRLLSLARKKTATSEMKSHWHLDPEAFRFYLFLSSHPISPMKSFVQIFSLFAILLFAGCAGHDRRLTSSATQYLGMDGSIFSQSSEAARNYAESISYWDGEGVSGEPRIVVSLGQQKAFFYKGGQLVGVSAISTGRDGHDTPPGNYKIIEKKEAHASNLYGDYVDADGNVMVAGVGIRQDPMPAGATFRGAPMPYWMRLTNSGVGLHAGFLPGVPDSRGCIRLPERMARAFYANAQLGTPVQVVY
jgi:hypothetical protein